MVDSISFLRYNMMNGKNATFGNYWGAGPDRPQKLLRAFTESFWTIYKYDTVTLVNLGMECRYWFIPIQISCSGNVRATICFLHQ